MFITYYTYLARNKQAKKRTSENHKPKALGIIGARNQSI